MGSGLRDEVVIHGVTPEGILKTDVFDTPKQRKLKYPFDRMEVGGFFKVKLMDSSAVTPEESIRLRNAVRAAAWRYAKPLGKKFTIRVTIEGVTVWRVV